MHPQQPKPPMQYAAKVKWVDGKPTVVGVPRIFDNSAEVRLKDLMRETLNLPYDGLDPRCMGLTKGEALILTLVNDAAEGLPGARSEVLDRLLGKPLQKSISVKGTLEDFLDSLPPNDNSPQDSEIIDL